MPEHNDATGSYDAQHRWRDRYRGDSRDATGSRAAGEGYVPLHPEAVCHYDDPCGCCDHCGGFTPDDPYGINPPPRGFEDDATGSRVTHGRHCSCTPCRAQDWSEPGLAPCGMHPDGCPRDPHATRDRVQIIARFIWDAYKRPNYPGYPFWENTSQIQREACERDARVLVDLLKATDG